MQGLQPTLRVFQPVCKVSPLGNPSGSTFFAFPIGILVCNEAVTETFNGKLELDPERGFSLQIKQYKKKLFFNRPTL
jgi:hypothetical protein